MKYLATILLLCAFPFAHCQDSLSEERMVTDRKIESRETKTLMFDAVPDFYPNIIGFNYFDLILLQFNFWYERILGDGLIGLRADVAAGLPRRNFFWPPRSTVVKVGAACNFYPFLQSRASYFTGPGLNYARKTKYWSYVEETGDVIQVEINNGFRFCPAKRLALTVGFSVGMEYDFFTQYARLCGSGEASIGIRF